MKFSYVQQVFFFSLLIGVTGVFFYMLSEYVSAVLWALIIAVVFYPLYERFLKFFHCRATTAALATVLSVVLLVVLPLVLVGSVVVSESLDIYQNLSTEEKTSFEGSGLLARVSQVTSYLEPYGISQVDAEEKIRDWGASLSQMVASSLVAFSQLTVTFLINTAIMLYLLFFFFRDGAKLSSIIMHHIPLGAGYENRLVARFSETVQAVVKGTLAIAALQGVIGGILFFAVGIANPMLWGVAMAVMSVVPLFGTALVWVPAALTMIFTGSLISGIIIILVGALVISVVDEFLRPVLVGRGSKMPDALVLLAIISGLATFGVSGFIIGPIIAALFLSFWSFFEERYRADLLKN
jgi:predicted PurR-regulated permease PerM